MTDAAEEAETVYRGQPTPARAKFVLFQLTESIGLDLIEPDEHPSVWRGFLDQNGEGIHHIAFRAE